MEGRFQNGLLPRIGLCIAAAVLVVIAVEIVVRLAFAESLRLSIAEMIKRKAVAQALLASEASEATQQLCRVHPFFGHTMRAQMDASPLGWQIETDRNGFRNQNGRFTLKPRIFAKTGSGQTQEKLSKKSTVFSMIAGD